MADYEINRNNCDYKTLEISAKYDIGGYNYFSGEQKARGYYANFSPCSKSNGWTSMTMLGNRNNSGYCIKIEETNRLSNKRLFYWEMKLREHGEELARLFSESKDKEIFEFIKNLI